MIEGRGVLKGEVAGRLRVYLQAHADDETGRGVEGSCPETREELELRSWVVAMGADYGLLVVPANWGPTLAAVRGAAGRQRVRLAAEAEVERLFPDCESGFTPPFGPAYGLPVYAAAQIAGHGAVLCATGRAGGRMLLSGADFERLCQPVWVRGEEGADEPGSRGSV